MELSQFRQVNHSAQLLATIKQQNPAIIDDILSTRIGYATQTALQSYTAEFKKNAQEEKHRYFNVIEKSIKGIIKDEKSKPCQAALEHREIYDGLIKSYNLDKDLFLSYGKAYSLKRDREDEDKDEDPPVGSNQGLKKRKTSNQQMIFQEETYQVTLEALKLSPCYPAFQITAEVPEIYMHQFWNTIKNIRKTDAYDFKLDKKKCRVDTEVFREILQICPRLPNQDFMELPSEDDLLSFIKELGYSGNCEMLSAIRTDQMHQPRRTFAAVINRCISGKSTGIDRLRESRAQVL
ncbi:hypothetical protein Tco_0295917 [Tanacetum coccineum]